LNASMFERLNAKTLVMSPIFTTFVGLNITK